jgi:glycosyltransferase involved in cell wall biosynthesis
MACGCPVIGGRWLAIPEFVEDGKNGLLFKSGSAAALAAAVRRFRPSQGMRRSALQTAKRYTVGKCTDRLEKLYEGLA